MHHPYSGLLLDRQAADGMTFHELLQSPEAYRAYDARFAAMTTTQAKSLVILMVPLFALLTSAVYGRARRFYAEHLVFSLHGYAFILLLISAAGLCVYVLLRGLASVGVEPAWQVVDTGLGLFMIGVMAPYLAVAVRRAFGAGRWAAVLGTAVLIPGFMAVLYVYRSILLHHHRRALKRQMSRKSEE